MSADLLCAFEEDRALAQALAHALGATFKPIRARRFPEGETHLTVPPAAGTAILLRRLNDPEPKLMPLLLAADALRRRGASRLVLVAPFMPYMRQDRLFHPGEALSRDVIGRLLGERFDRIVTVQAHLHRTMDLADVFRPAQIDNLLAARLLAAVEGWPRDAVAVAPDREATPWARSFAAVLGGAWTSCAKQRSGDREVALVLKHPQRVVGRHAILVDDIASTGVTLMRAAEALLGAGATGVDVAVVHAFLSAADEAALQRAGVRCIVSTDSLPHPTNAVSLCGLLSTALRSELHS
jgi:ribose-phosphate pyrophosphokinase